MAALRDLTRRCLLHPVAQGAEPDGGIGSEELAEGEETRSVAGLVMGEGLP
jgi:hypothetical protein